MSRRRRILHENVDNHQYPLLFQSRILIIHQKSIIIDTTLHRQCTGKENCQLFDESQERRIKWFNLKQSWKASGG